MRAKEGIFKFASYTAILFTAATVISSTLQLLQGNPYDTNVHLLLRLVVCMIAVGFVYIFKKIHLNNIYLETLLQYVLSMASLFSLLFVTGFFVELSKNAYRDIFLNYTVIFLLVASVMIFLHKRKNK